MNLGDRVTVNMLDPRERILKDIKQIIGPGMPGNGTVRKLKKLQRELKMYENTGF